MRIKGIYDVYDVDETAPFAEGGNADLFRCRASGLVYKRYKKLVRERSATTQLFSVMQMGRKVLVDEHAEPGSTPESSINWPIDLIPAAADYDAVQGVIIPMIPSRFFDEGDLKDFSYLSLARSQPPLAIVRVPVLIRLAEIMAWLDRHELVHGDISYKNMVWSEDPPGSYLIDADGLQRRGHPTQSTATAQWTDPRLTTHMIARHDHFSDWYALGLAMYRGLFLNPGALGRRPDGTWAQPASLPSALDPEIRKLIFETLSDPLSVATRARPSSWVATLIRVYVTNGAFDRARLKILDDFAEQRREEERRKAQASRAQSARAPRSPSPTPGPQTVHRPPHTPVQPPPAKRPPYVRPPSPPGPPARTWQNHVARMLQWRPRRPGVAAVGLFLAVSWVVSAATPESESSPGGSRPSGAVGGTSEPRDDDKYEPPSGQSKPGGSSNGGPKFPAGDSPGRPGTWIAQLDSVAIGAGRHELNDMLRISRDTIPRARVLVSSKFASLEPGYWIVYHSGPFRSGVHALEFCAEKGRTRTDRDLCIGRYLSHQADELRFMCFPPARRHTGHCHHRTRG